MFKTSVITDEIHQDFSTAVKLAVKHGLDAVEIRSVYERGPFELTDDDMASICSVLRETGLKVCCISSPFYKCEMGNTEEIAGHMAGLKRCIRMADKFGAEYIRGFTFWARPGMEFNPPAIANYFAEPVKLLEESGKTLVLESDPAVQASNAETLARVIGAVNSPRVRALWDPGNDIYDPRGEKPYPDGYNFIRPWMVHMHLKDAAKKNGKPEGTPVGRGDVDLRGQFRSLISDGYSGYVSLETHYRPAGQLTEELMAMPRGAAFSHGGYEATDESLGLWREMLDHL